MKQFNLLGHLCPVCKGNVFASRRDKVFCSVQCKNRHHATQRQLHIFPESENFKHRRRNFVVLSGVIGENCNNAEVKLAAVEEFGFRLNHCDREIMPFRKSKISGFISAYNLLGFRVEEFRGGILKISRSSSADRDRPRSESDEVRGMFYRRWLHEFPEHDASVSKREVLDNYGVWRE